MEIAVGKRTDPPLAVAAVENTMVEEDVAAVVVDTKETTVEVVDPTEVATTEIGQRRLHHHQPLQPVPPAQQAI